MSATAATVMLVEDDPSLGQLLAEELEMDGYAVERAATVQEARGLLQQQRPALIVSDLRLPDGDGMQVLAFQQAEHPGIPFIVITAFGTVDQAVEALKAGADDFLTKPLSTDHLRLKIKRLLAQADVNRQLAEIQSRQQGEQNMGLVGDSPAMERLRGEIRQVARSQAAVLINGESGTGKELVARAIHNQSDRAERAFLAVNCAGIPPDLMESEFFGHEAGAFTGARQARKGLFAEASGGTLLLDEIGEMPLSLQAKLLRVLQEGAIKPVGADHEETVDVRILAATHVNLMKAVEDGLFREDLYYRLETLSLPVPPLRERGEDVELLAMHFLKEACRRHNRGFIKFSEVTLRVLRDYPFPGNVRELSSAIERAVPSVMATPFNRSICPSASASARVRCRHPRLILRRLTFRNGPHWKPCSRTTCAKSWQRLMATNAVLPRYSVSTGEHSIAGWTRPRSRTDDKSEAGHAVRPGHGIALVHGGYSVQAGSGRPGAGTNAAGGLFSLHRGDGAGAGDHGPVAAGVPAFPPSVPSVHRYGADQSLPVLLPAFRRLRPADRPGGPAHKLHLGAGAGLSVSAVSGPEAAPYRYPGRAGVLRRGSGDCHSWSSYLPEFFRPAGCIPGAGQYFGLGVLLDYCHPGHP